MKPDLERLTLSVCDLCRQTGKFILAELDHVKESDILTKSPNNFVTYVDKQSEDRLKERLSALLPGSGFIAEESPDARMAENYNWIIDPLDGTTNFIHGIPLFSISIALMEGKNIVSGVVYEMNLAECFYAWAGSKAYLNGKEIHVSETSGINGSLFATGFPYYDYSKLDEYMNFFRFLLKNSRGARRLGSAAADLAYVACGRFDGFYEYGLSPWDVAAGALIVKQAGGRVTDFKGQENFLMGKEIIATNLNLYSNFMQAFRKFF